MKCRKCSSKETRVTVTVPHGNEVWRYCRCLKCDERFKTIEVYESKKRGAVPGVKQHANCILQGEKNGSSVLTEANIETIRKHAENKATYKQIAAEFGIHESTVYRIVKRKVWKHVA